MVDKTSISGTVLPIHTAGQAYANPPDGATPLEETVTGTTQHHTPTPATGVGALTHRERVVLAELGEDITLEEIARRLWVTRNTVKSQLRSAYRKMGVSTRAEAVAWAQAHGI